MIRRLTMVLSLLLVVAVMVTPAFAFSLPGMKSHETGKITAIDRDARTFTLAEDKDAKKLTFHVKDRAMLVNLRTGEHVRVAYKKDGARLVASEIVEKANKTTASRR